MSKIVQAAGLLVWRQRNAADPVEFLLLQASYEPYHWTPPKGHVDPGEEDNLQGTALRETSEEAGIEANALQIDLSFKKVLEYQVKGKPKEVTYWPAKLIDLTKDARLSHEHKDFKWLQVEEACKLAKFAEMETLIREMHQHILGQKL